MPPFFVTDIMTTVLHERGFRIRPASHDSATVDALADILVSVVEGGASVGFIAPLAPENARAFWRMTLESAGRGERIVLVAEDNGSGTVIGTVQLIPAAAENQPHRAEIAKMQVHPRWQRRGVGAALLHAAEAQARELGRTLLTLDTATGSDAERLYVRTGWERCGVIPDYAYWPDGVRKCSTALFYRRLD